MQGQGTGDKIPGLTEGVRRELAQKAMPRYQSHKKVWALKIADLEWEPSSGVGTITPAEEGYTTFQTRPGWADKFDGSTEDLGYFVMYQDGYESWSPTKAFEEGYTRL